EPARAQRPPACVEAGVKGSARRPGWLRAFGWLVLLLGSLALVTWRQTRALELEGELREIETPRAMAEAALVARVPPVERLRSRARIVRVARERLGMHLPEGDEIVFLSVEATPAASAVEEEG